MRKKDPYFRNFLSNASPERTPFSRSGRKDSGHYFIYMTNSRRWTLLLDKYKYDEINDEALQQIPVGYNQLWLFKKIFSTRRFTKRQVISESVANHSFTRDYPPELKRADWPNNLYVVLREPYDFLTKDGDVLTFCLQESDAVDAANIYTLQKNRRAVVGLLVWDIQWH